MKMNRGTLRCAAKLEIRAPNCWWRRPVTRSFAPGISDNALPETSIRLLVFRRRHPEFLAVHILEAMLQHWPILFLQYLFINVHAVIRVEADDILVVGSMMDLAK